MTESKTERQLHSAGQRRINQVWEYTQAVIASMVVLTTCLGVFIGRIIQHDTAIPFPSEWWAILGLVIGFYFGRTNHTRPEANL